MKINQIVSTCVLLGASIVPSALALNFSFTGNLSGDDDVQLFNFSILAPSTVTLLSLGYAGGLNDAGALIPDGGFDPILTLFDASGAFIDENDDGFPVAADPTTGEEFDSLLEVLLGVGDYTVALSQFAAYAVLPNLSDGFFTSETTGFEDVTGDIRTSAWALDILDVDSAETIPLPSNIPTGVPFPTPDTGSTALLLGAGLLGLAAVRRRMGCS